MLWPLCVASVEVSRLDVLDSIRAVCPTEAVESESGGDMHKVRQEGIVLGCSTIRLPCSFLESTWSVYYIDIIAL